MNATIEWIRTPPSGIGRPYTTVAHFPNCNYEGSWSLVVEKINGEDKHWEAKVYFLAQEAPHHLLTHGAEFGLYEGFKCVANGQIK